MIITDVRQLESLRFDGEPADADLVRGQLCLCQDDLDVLDFEAAASGFTESIIGVVCWEGYAVVRGGGNAPILATARVPGLNVLCRVIDGGLAVAPASDPNRVVRLADSLTHVHAVVGRYYVLRSQGQPEEVP